jgi:hypothetical protein
MAMITLNGGSAVVIDLKKYAVVKRYADQITAFGNVVSSDGRFMVFSDRSGLVLYDREARKEIYKSSPDEAGFNGTYPDEGIIFVGHSKFKVENI